MPSALLLIPGGDIPALVAVTPASAAAAKSAYALTDLGNLGDGVSLGFGINASGEVVGRSYLDKVFLATNNHGVIVGQSSLRAWIWSGGVFQNLNNLIPPGSGVHPRQRHRDQRQRPDRRQRLQRPRPGARVRAHTQLVTASRTYHRPA